MANNNHNSPVALSYAQALLDLATQSQQTEAVEQEMEDLKQIVLTNPSFQQLLADPAIGHVEREQLLEKVFRGKLSPLTMNLLGVMNLKGRLGMLIEIADAYSDLLAQQQGKVEVDVTVAQRLSPDDLEQVRLKISAAIKKDAVVHQYVDDSIIGGLVIRVQDQLIDASTRYQLLAMKEQLLAAKPH